MVVDNGTGAVELERETGKSTARPCFASMRISATGERSTRRRVPAHGDALVLLNDDSVVDAGYVEAIAGALDRPAAW